MAQSTHLRKYGVETTIDFEVYEVDGVDLRTDWVPAAADCEVMKDEGASTQCTNTATDEGSTYSIVLTATEMQAARLMLKVVDAATKVFLDKVIVIETYGNASAMHAMDLDDAVRGGMSALPNAAADAAGGLAISDAGGLDLDAMNTAAVRLTAARATIIDDWANAGRLDVLLDAIKAVTDALPDSGALTTIGADTARLTAARAAVLTDWIDAGRLDALLDAIKAVTDALPDSGALTTIGADTARLTAARAGALTDWVNGGRLDLILDIIAADTTTDIPALLPAALVGGRIDATVDATGMESGAVATILTTAMTEAYATDGSAPTIAQALCLLISALTEFSISGTTITAKKLDGSTTSSTYTLDDATNPTSRTRTT